MLLQSVANVNGSCDDSAVTPSPEKRKQASQFRRQLVKNALVRAAERPDWSKVTPIKRADDRVVKNVRRGC